MKGFLPRIRSAITWPTAGLCWNPWPLNPLARKKPGRPGSLPQDGMVIRGYFVGASPAAVDLRFFHERNAVDRIFGHLHHGIVIDIDIE